MNDPLSKAYVYTDGQGLSELKAQARRQTPESLQAVARQFEALFLQHMLKSMREASPATDSDLMESGQTRFYRGMFDQQIALTLAQGQGIGLARAIARQLGASVGVPVEGKARTPVVDQSLIPVKQTSVRVQAPTPPSTVQAAGNTPPERAKPGPQSVPDISRAAQTHPSTAVKQARVKHVMDVPTPPSQTSDKQAEPKVPAETSQHLGAAAVWPPKTPGDFVRALWPHALRAAKVLGVAPEVMIAQSALETGWGSRVIGRAQGASGFNLFGIKADTAWKGDKITAGTHEYYAGERVRERAGFRAYGSIAESFEDYVGFLQSNPRYTSALEQAGDAKAFLNGLQEAGYATDPAYAEKIQQILGRGSFQDLVGGLKNTPGRPIS